MRLHFATFIMVMGLSGAALGQPAVPMPPVPSPATPSPPAAAAQSVAPAVLSDGDVAIYRKVMAAERAGEFARASSLMGQIGDDSLQGYAQALHYLAAKKITAAPLVEWLKQYRDLAIADRIYRLAVAHSTRKVRRKHKTITIAVVTNIPAPAGVGRRRASSIGET